MKNITPKTLSLISRIYDAGLSSAEWPDILEELTWHHSSLGSALFYDDSRHPELNGIVTAFSHFWTCDNNKEKYYSYIADEDPTVKVMRKTPPRTILSTDSIPLTEKLRIAPYALKMRRSFGISSAVAVKLNNTGAWSDILTFQYNVKHGPMRPEEMQQLSIFVPHVAKAIEISRPLTLLEQRFKAVLEALDHFHVGVIILAESGVQVLSNRAAKKILDQKDGLSLNAWDMLTVSDQEPQARLTEAIRLTTATAGADGTTDSILLRIPRRSERDAFLMEILPLTDQNREIGSNFSGCMVFMIDPADTSHVSTEGMKELYHLSDAEADTCRLLVEGHTNPQIADIRGVTPETVKSQVQSMLQKTGSENRSNLVKLAMSINLPIDNPKTS